jgi:hypothetical protein
MTVPSTPQSEERCARERVRAIQRARAAKPRPTPAGAPR